MAYTRQFLVPHPWNNPIFSHPTCHPYPYSDPIKSLLINISHLPHVEIDTILGIANFLVLSASEGLVERLRLGRGDKGLGMEWGAIALRLKTKAFGWSVIELALNAFRGIWRPSVGRGSLGRLGMWRTSRGRLGM